MTRLMVLCAKGRVDLLCLLLDSLHFKFAYGQLCVHFGVSCKVCVNIPFIPCGFQLNFPLLMLEKSWDILASFPFKFPKC